MGVPKKYSPDFHVLITSTYLCPQTMVSALRALVSQVTS